MLSTLHTCRSNSGVLLVCTITSKFMLPESFKLKGHISRTHVRIHSSLMGPSHSHSESPT